jgi:opine dehydrogenase
MAPHLADGQIIVLNPGATGGALEVRSTLLENSCQAKVLVAETDTLLYTCRSPKAGETIIQGIKCQVNVAALPPKDVATVVAALNTAFPLYKAVPNILYTSLSNANSMMHPTPTLLNAGRIESKESFDYYTDGLTPSIARVVEAVDKERVGICAVFGIKVDSIQEWYTRCYGVTGKNLHEEVHNVAAYKGVKGPTTLDTRYLFEDVPTGLVPLAQLGQAMGVPTPTISAVVELSNKLLGRNYWEEGRSLKRLGLQGKTSEEIRQLVL